MEYAESNLYRKREVGMICDAVGTSLYETATLHHHEASPEGDATQHVGFKGIYL